MADREDLFPGRPLISDGAWAGWRLWEGSDPYEDLTGPYYSRVEPDGSVVCALRLERRHMNGGGFMHGGAMMTFADFCLFVIGRPALKEQYAVTVSLNGDFVGPAHEGDLVEGRGDIVRAGGSLVFMRGLLSTGGRTILNFSGVVKKTGKRPA